MKFLKELKTAKEAAIAAGSFLVKNQKDFNFTKGIKIKSKTQIQTWLDLASEKLILKRLKQEFPKYGFLSEEAGVGGEQKNRWIVDPLDGTTNYVLGLKAYGVSIALMLEGKIVLGVINIPETKQLFWATKSGGAYVNGKKIHASQKTNLNKAFLTFCHGSDLVDLKSAIKLYKVFKLKGLEYRQIGSAALELCLVACGRTEAINLPGANLYDVAAGALIVSEAGGKVTDFKNKTWPEKNGDLLASNGLLHQDLLKIIQTTLNK